MDTRFSFIAVAAIAVIALSLFLSGCVKQQVSSDCAALSQPSQTYEKALCYQNVAIYKSIYGGPSARAEAIAACDALRSDSSTSEYDEVYRSCINEIAANLQDPTVCDKLPSASFVSTVLNIDTRSSQIKACQASARPPANTVCGTAVAFIMFPLAAAAYLSYSQGAGRGGKKKKQRHA
ncbi:MAG: hypothetical protein WC506_02200 [Candidatus Micrarchaeia archaeon]